MRSNCVARVPFGYRLAPAHRFGSKQARYDVSAKQNRDITMRSTLSLDPDVAQLLQEAMARSKKPYKTVVNDALRRGLSALQVQKRSAFKVEAFAMGWDATLDPAGFNRLVDELAVEDFLAVQRRLTDSSAL